MSQEQKTIKIISLLLLVIGVLRIALGVVFITAPESEFTSAGVLPITASTNATKMISIAVMLIYGVLTVYFGWVGVKTANRPRNVEEYIHLCYLALLLLVIEALVPTSNYAAALLALPISIIMVVVALYKAKAIAKRADQ